MKALALLLAVVLTISSFGSTVATVAAQTGNCDTSGTVNGTATPVAGIVGDTIVIMATGFTPSDAVSFWLTYTPTGAVVGTPAPIPGGVNPDGTVGPLPLTITPQLGALSGRWAITFQGTPSNHTAVIYFCIGFRQAQATPTSPPAPAPTSTPQPAAPTSTPQPAAPTTQATALPTETAAAQPTATSPALPTEALPAPVALDTPTPSTVAGGVIGTTPGMPTTGQHDNVLLVLAALLALSLLTFGAGWVARRNA